MIQFTLSAVFAVRDGYTGKPITQSSVQCVLDGMPVKPQYRNGGYLVFVNLEEGSHTLILKGAYFCDEKIAFDVKKGDYDIASITLKPQKNYPFARAIVTLEGTVEKNKKPVQDTPVWVAEVEKGIEMKVAQDGVVEGNTSMKLFCRGDTQMLFFPCNYMIIDGNKSEAVTLTSIEEEVAYLSAPLEFAHKRGVLIIRAQIYRTDDAGKFEAYFREATEAYILHGKSVKQISLNKGENTLTL